mgnify:CR=1 FL=1
MGTDPEMRSDFEHVLCSAPNLLYKFIESLLFTANKKNTKLIHFCILLHIISYYYGFPCGKKHLEPVKISDFHCYLLTKIPLDSYIIYGKHEDHPTSAKPTIIEVFLTIRTVRSSLSKHRGPRPQQNGGTGPFKKSRFGKHEIKCDKIVQDLQV